VHAGEITARPVPAPEEAPDLFLEGGEIEGVDREPEGLPVRLEEVPVLLPPDLVEEGLLVHGERGVERDGYREILGPVDMVATCSVGSAGHPALTSPFLA